MKIARLVSRTVIGGLFIGHGTQKLFGLFGGPGRAGTEAMMEQLDMYPARYQALAAGVTETAGGALLALGLATPLAATSLIGTMITAIRKVHLSNGAWAANGGYEYNLVLIAALLDLAENGPGDLSLDAAAGLDTNGPAWGVGALALAAAASALAVEVGRRSAPAVRSGAAGPISTETAADPTTVGAQG